MSIEIIPIADLPLVVATDSDHVAGAQAGNARGFRVGGPGGIARNDALGGLSPSSSGFRTLLNFGGKGDDAFNNSAKLASAIDSGENIMVTPGTYRLSSSVIKSLVAGQRLMAMPGAVFRVMDALGLGITAAGVGAGIEGLSFVGTSRTDDRIGLQLGAMDMANVRGITCMNLETGIDHLPKARATWYSGADHYPGSAIRDSVFRGCGQAINLHNLAEYVSVSDCEMFDCDVAFYTEAGNFRLVNSTISGCRIGAWVKGGGTNSDHGTIAGNTINHCGQVGILLDGIALSMLVEGNQVWATANSTPWPDYGKNYNLFLRNCRRVTSRGNIYANMATPIGFDGLVDSSFADHVDDTATPIIRYFYCEGHGSFGFNRNLDIRMAPTNSAAVINVVDNYAAANNNNFRIRTASQSHGVVLDNTVVIDYIHDGRQDQVTAVGGYANAILIPNFRKGTDFEIMVLTAAATPITVTLPTGTTGFSAAPGAAVSGTTVTLKGNRVLYRFTSTPTQSGWIITATGGQIAPVAAVAAGTTYTLTTTVAAVDFGTTDPAIVLAEPGTYLIRAQIQVDSQAATVGTTQNLDWRIRRTNNTAINISQQIVDLPAQSAATITVGTYELEAVYTTNNSTDAITLFAGLSAALGAGTMKVIQASIIAVKQF